MPQYSVEDDICPLLVSGESKGLSLTIAHVTVHHYVIRFSSSQLSHLMSCKFLNYCKSVVEVQALVCIYDNLA